MFKRKTKEIKSIEKTLKMLADYHGMNMDNEQFLRQYRHLISMYFLLVKRAGTKPLKELQC